MLRLLYRPRLLIQAHSHLSSLQFNSIQKSSFLTSDRQLDLFRKPKFICGATPLQAERFLSLSKTSFEGDTVFKRIKNKITSMNAKSKVSIGGILAYEKCADEVDLKTFFAYFNLPDTFNSFFLVLQLHVWMCIVACVAERYGRHFRNTIVDAMWEDVEQRMKYIREMGSTVRKKHLTDMVAQFQAAIISYDEGILSDDSVLASAAWRTLYNFQDVDPRLLENIVIYIRKQVNHLDSLHSEDLMNHGKITFLPISSVIQPITPVKST